MKQLVGLVLLIIFFPFFLSGLGEVIMSSPVIGTCIASLAGWVLVKRG